ncbi:MAG: hypothetical protein QM478_02170 [Flavobacteriaceae bacterium]
MKHYLILLFAVITLAGCSSNDDDTNYHFEYVPVLSADVPEEFVFGQTYRLTVTYEMPNSCYFFYHYDYIYDGPSRMIAPIAIVNDDEVCTQVPYEGEFFIFVQALQNEPYTFNFWQGEDVDGEPIYLTFEVPVI